MIWINSLFMVVGLVWILASFHKNLKAGKASAVLFYSGLALVVGAGVNLFVNSFVLLIIIFGVVNLTAFYIFMFKKPD
ncbi:hypothetical protein CR194_04170 [Salipaludibacillus keqinensis]|uniref:Uncharacterized protein n=1 Tax=Salipaludibacillus keqinensis TaxID=2045207 RepID=A0A323TKU4_9BACI|nr:hypothetical protein [Salipaludibacillus keqinensis]PYZ94736.1 hypothetical protein CR194_04170 [Salipaludibacillus keqinensis]